MKSAGQTSIGSLDAAGTSLEEIRRLQGEKDVSAEDVDPTAIYTNYNIGQYEDPRDAWQRRISGAEFDSTGEGGIIGGIPGMLRQGLRSRALQQAVKEAEKTGDWSDIDPEIRREYEMAQEADEMDQINRDILDWTQKVLKGDFSLSDETQKEIEASVGRLRKPLLSAINEMEAKARQTGASITESINEYSKKINETGLGVGQALEEAEAQVKHTGSTMSEALDRSIALNRQLTMQGLQDINEDLRKNMAERAAQLGRPPTDPAFVKELHDQMSEEMTKAGTQLAATEAQARVRLAERTGEGLEGIQQQRVGLAERTGSGQEKVALLRQEEALRRGQESQGLAAKRGEVMGKTAEYGEDLRQKYKTQYPQMAIQAGKQAVDWQNYYRRQLPMSNVMAGFSPVTGQQRLLSGERTQQGTTTTTSTPSPFSAATDVLGAGAGLAGTAYDIWG